MNLVQKAELSLGSAALITLSLLVLLGIGAYNISNNVAKNTKLDVIL